jgi:demethylmenaquinone methyltransferase/2-methoxy-6-polyprenyl-1,4-benzoquinol methylase
VTGYVDKMTQSKPLYAMFTAVPPRYDLINRIVTWGLDERWRRKAARECLTARPKKVLDLCCGTGDLAINLARLAENNVELVGVDYSPPMLEIATRKAKPLTGRAKISFTYGDATNLPFPDGYFDSIGISFAFRNLTYKNPLAQRHIAEVLRVLSSGGRFVIVETSQPKAKLVKKLYHLYLRWFVFRVGYLLSGNRGAYHYLAESAARFYTSEELKEMLVTAGFRKVSFHPLFWGAIGIHVAIK